MTEVTRDLAALLDHTGHAALIGASPKAWTRTADAAGHPMWSSDEPPGLFMLNLADLCEYAESSGARVAAVLPEGATEPPQGSEVQMRCPTHGSGYDTTRDATGWPFGVRHLTWKEFQRKAAGAGMTGELLAVPVAEPGDGKETASSLHSGAQNESPHAVEARQITDDADWGALITWCGGYDVNHPDDGWTLAVPGAGVARDGDWIVRGGDGRFAVVPAGHLGAILRASGAALPRTTKH